MKNVINVHQIAVTASQAIGVSKNTLYHKIRILHDTGTAPTNMAEAEKEAVKKALLEQAQKHTELAERL